MINNFDELLDHASTVRGKNVVVIAPANAETFEAIREAQERLGVGFFLVGNQDTIARGMAGAPRVEVIHQPDLRQALETAVELVHKGEADILMKGGIDTATMMKAVLHPEKGLRTGRLLSDIFLFEHSARQGNKFVMITDGGLTLAPDLNDKVELIANAVAVAHALGNPLPKVAVLSATEFVLSNLPSTLDAAALSKMNDRGQIAGCVVDGPLALDNALFAEAAQEKKITSRVAGQAEILVAAGIEAANSLAKGITYFGDVRLAHVIVGAQVPVLIPSRADKSDAKLLSVALGMIMSGQKRNAAA